jgi:hypothetical protein
MKKHTYSMIFSLSFIFISKFIFTIFPDNLNGNYNLICLTSCLYLIAHTVPLLYFLQFSNYIETGTGSRLALDLLVTALCINLFHRIAIAFLTLGISNILLERILYQIKYFVPVILYLAFTFFFFRLRKKTAIKVFSQYNKIYLMNGISFGLLSLFTIAGLIDHIAKAELYVSFQGTSAPIRMISYLVMIFVFYVSLRFYVGILKIIERELKEN